MREGLDRRGEDAAAAHARACGARVIARNVRAPGGELDLILDDGGVLAFAEVKTRASTRCGGPKEGVTAIKVRRIMRMALAWLEARGAGFDLLCCFDVFLVELRGDGFAVEWCRDVFPAAPLDELERP